MTLILRLTFRDGLPHVERIDPADFYKPSPLPPEGYVYSWDVARRLTSDPPAS